MKRWGLFLWLLASCFLLLESAFAASFDPSKKWMTIKTDHFQVHYPQELEVVAKDTAGILEEVHAKLSPELKWKPFGRTEVIVTDSTDARSLFATQATGLQTGEVRQNQHAKRSDLAVG